MSSTIDQLKKYCTSLVSYQRRETIEVTIGDVPMGAHHPIRIQSMTTVDTMDTIGSVEQTIRMVEAGCEYVRITAPSLKEAQNLTEIKKELRRRGYQVPLVADIHFTPNAAELAARIVEKVRVNPGNYADKKRFETIDYTEASYQAELDRIREKFIPLVKICKEYGTAMRIGTNHGSLSDRIMSRYGDSPLGMVESALEFLRIAEDEGYYNIVLSMKSSNPQVMVQAYRLLVHKLEAGNFKPYPLHLGVTEAGDGEDGRIKSAVGIGTLLEDGLGDTIRVSLTEEPEAEVPVAQQLADRYKTRTSIPEIPEVEENPLTPFEFNRRKSRAVLNLGGDHPIPRVIADLSHRTEISAASLFPFGYTYAIALDKWKISDFACDYLYLGKNSIAFEIPGTLALLQDSSVWKQPAGQERIYPVWNLEDYLDSNLMKSPELNVLRTDYSSLDARLASILRADETAVLWLETNHDHGMAEQRRAFIDLMLAYCDAPVIIARHYKNTNTDEFQLYAATDFGALLVDGLGDAIFIHHQEGLAPKFINETCFGILQATRSRISKTEYISCPSCGRTLFDLQVTTHNIRVRTNHLKGIKIGIMGCIVNGPGEMADADYGYVGSGPGRITLYKGKEVVRKNVPTAEAVDELVKLIQEHGDWVEPQPLNE